MSQHDNPIQRENIANYDSAWSVTEYTREKGLRPLEAALIHEFFPQRPGLRILDLGCGAGRTTIGLAELGYSPTAIDLSERLLEEARLRFPSLDFRLMDATALQFEDASFDAAFFSYNGIDCIYPLEGRLRCMKEVCRILKPGGVFLLSTHNLVGHFFSGGFLYLKGYVNALRMLAAQMGNRLAREWYIKYSDDGGSQYLFSAPPARTREQLERSGFEVLAIRGGGGEPRMRTLALRHPHIHFVARKQG